MSKTSSTKPKRKFVYRADVEARKRHIRYLEHKFAGAFRRRAAAKRWAEKYSRAGGDHA